MASCSPLLAAERFRSGSSLDHRSPFLKRIQKRYDIQHPYIALYAKHARLRVTQKRSSPHVRVSASAESLNEGSMNHSTKGHWSSRLYDAIQEDLRRDIGLDIADFKAIIEETIARLASLLTKDLPAVIRSLEAKTAELKVTAAEQFKAVQTWNNLELWRDFKKWSSVRWAASLLVTLLSMAAIFSGYRLLRSSADLQLANRWLESAIPDPNPQNLNRVQRNLLRQKLPKGVSLSRFVRKGDEYIRDDDFVGESLWDEEEDETLTSVQAEQKPVTGKVSSWQDKLAGWNNILDRKSSAEASGVRYAPRVDWKVYIAEFKKAADARLALKNDVTKSAAFHVSRTWWKYRPTVPYSWLLSLIRRGEVVSAVYSEDMRHLYVQLSHGFPNEFKVDIPVDPNLYADLNNRGVSVGMVTRSHLPPFLRGAAVLAPGLLAIYFISTVLYRLRKVLDERVEDMRVVTDTKSILPKQTMGGKFTTWADVVVPPMVQSELLEMVSFLDKAMEFYRRRIKVPRGVLISGPPGTGKTLLVRALVHAVQLPIVYASGAEFVDSNGGGAEALNDLFYQARCMAPCLVFIDEIDALATKGARNDEQRQAAYLELLAELDGEPEHTDVDRFSPRQRIMLICATNRPDALDEDFLLPGRTDKHIILGKPDEEGRIRLFGVHSRDRNLAEDVDFSKLMYRTVGFTGADIRALINEASMLAVRRQSKVIAQEDFEAALDKTMFEGLGLSMTEEDEKLVYARVPEDIRYLLSVHEAGHVLLAHLFPRYDCHGITQIAPAGQEEAMTTFYPRQDLLDVGMTSTGYLKMHMVVSQGGRCAEMLTFGREELTDGCSGDLLYITKLARELTVGVANSKFGILPVTFRERPRPTPKADKIRLIPKNWSGRGVETAKMSAPLSDIFTREVSKYMTESEAVAMEALTANRHILDDLIQHLFVNYRIKGPEATEFIRARNPVMLPDYMNEDFHTPMPDEIPEIKVDPYKPGRYEPLDIYQAPLHRC